MNTKNTRMVLGAGLIIVCAAASYAVVGTTPPRPGGVEHRLSQDDTQAHGTAAAAVDVQEQELVDEPSTHAVERAVVDVDLSDYRSRPLRAYLSHLSPDDRDHFTASCAARGLDLDAPVALASWDRVKEHALKYFESTPEALGSWAENYIDEPGFVNDPYDSKAVEDALKSMGLREVRPEAIDSARAVIIDHEVEMRASAAEVANALASARWLAWESESYTRTPRFGVPPRADRAKKCAMTVNGGVAGWCLTYRIYEEDHPQLQSALEMNRASRRAFHKAITRVVEAELVR